MLAFSPTKYTSKGCIESLNKKEFTQQEQILEVNSRITEIDLEDVRNVKVSENLTIENKLNETLTYVRFGFDNVIRDLEIYNDTNSLNYVFEIISNEIIINLETELDLNQTFSLTFSYNLITEIPFFSSRKESYYFFRYYPSLNYFTKYYRLCIKLPRNCFLHHFEHSDSYHPEDAVEITQEYRTNLYWELEDFQVQESFVFFVFFDEPLERITPIWIVIVAPLSGVIGGAAGVFWLMKRKERNLLKEAVTTFLTDDQKLLLEILIDNEGRITQKEIIEKTGFTKSKTSRNLVSLEKNNLITKERWGREYKVYITEKGRKFIESSNK